MQNVVLRFRRVWAAPILVFSAVACAEQDPAHRDRGNASESNVELTQVEQEPQEPATPKGPSVSWEQAQSIVRAKIDSADRKLRRVRGLSRDERTQLRRDVNAVQIERAKRLGIQPGSPVEQLVAAGQLVRLADSTEYWVVRRLNYSIPYLTPSAEAMLVEIGQRFHRELDAMGVPRFRIDITSVLRTPDKQAALRRANSNASRIESAHEFGTTVDLAYRRFAAPLASDEIVLDPLGRQISDSLMVEAAGVRSGELQAVLGRVLHQMQAEGKLLVRMERRQTVYHITVGRAYPARTRAD